MNPLIQLKKATPPFLGAFVLVCLTLSPRVHAVVPPPDGGYPGGNTAEGLNSLLSLTSGQNNTAVGLNSLSSTNIGVNNTAIGSAALRFNTTGNNNTASGAGALRNNTTGSVNVANGLNALQNNRTGYNNTAIGVSALFSNAFGLGNTAVGRDALLSNTRGSWNTAAGLDALVENTTGESNIAIGIAALRFNTTGSYNVALGAVAGANSTTGFNNIYIGANLGGTTGESNTCYIGSIFNQVSVSGVPVLINSASKLGTATSSKRFKENIEPMDKASEGLFSLKPVAFRYRKEIDVQGIPQFGLVAEDVEKVNPDLVVRDKEGKPYSVRYEAVNAMLLNEFLKEHRKVENLEATVAQQHKDFEAAVAELKGQIQMVSAQLEASKPPPQVVLNNP